MIRKSGLFRAAFTLLEILIAIVVLVIGITGIVAVFPTAIKSGNQTVVDSYASLITQSVVDAVNVGIRESRYRTNPIPPAESWDYFIFEHDGVQDDITNTTPEQYFTVSKFDFCILLPRGTPTNVTKDNEIVLHFPCPKNKVNARANPTTGNLDNLNDEVAKAENLVPNTKGDLHFPVAKTFLLGRRIDPNVNPNPIRDEFLGELIAGSGTGGERLIKDPYPQYSFSFSIRRARIDTNAPRGVLDAKDFFSDNLFEVKVKIFRNFNESQSGLNPVPRNNYWVHEFVTLIST
jgi:type II secretory pathway pseudopilin PulG